LLALKFQKKIGAHLCALERVSASRPARRRFSFFGFFFFTISAGRLVA
jgi:hypothetical protein